MRSDTMTPMLNELSMKSIEDYFNQIEQEDKNGDDFLTSNF
jgi:hypothetical protein